VFRQASPAVMSSQFHLIFEE
jgi:hypothetical protein